MSTPRPRLVHLACALAALGLASIGCGADARSAEAVAVRSSAVERSPSFSKTPRLIAPLSGSIAASAHPLLRWERFKLVTVEICADRDCAEVLQSFEVHGESAQPPAPISAGVRFWRVRARIGPPGARPTSATWELIVPPGAVGPATATLGSRLDIDADGYADAVVRAQSYTRETDTLHLLPGSPAGVQLGAERLIPLSTEILGLGLAAAGDVNGDGFGDLAVTDGAGVEIYAGSPAGPIGTALVELPPPAGVSAYSFGFQLAALGDVNTDGYADLAAADGFGMIWVYHGAPGGPAAAPSWVMDSRALAPGISAGLLTAADLDGDGAGDLVLAEASEAGAAVRWIRGGATGLEAPDGARVIARPATPRGTACDVNGDGYPDLVLAEGETMTVLPSGPAGPSAETQVLASSRFAVLQAGDFNGDGYGDIARASSLPTESFYFTDDKIEILVGGAAGLSSVPASVLLETSYLPDNHSNFGLRMSAADFDRDGRDDLLVGAPPPQPTPFFDESLSTAYVFPGAPTGVDTRPAQSLAGTPGYGYNVTAGAPQGRF